MPSKKPTCAAFDDAMRSMERRDERWLYVAGVDLSTSRDYPPFSRLPYRTGGITA